MSRRRDRGSVPALLAAAVLATAAPAPAAAQEGGRGLKVFISADMEGVAGAVTGDQLGPGGFEYERFRRFMTEEVLAAIRGARAAGATEVLVADAHGNGQNLLLELLPEDVRVVRSWPRPLGMMQGIDSTFAAAILLGYHAATTNPQGVRAHTLSSATLADVRLNGRSAPEAAISGAIAGHFGVPVVTVSGDDAAVEEAASILGNVERAIVKWNHSFHSATTLTPGAAARRIEEAARRGVERRGEIGPFRLETPVTLEVRFKNYRPSQVLALLPGVERTGSHTVRFVGRDVPEVSRFLQFLTGYRADLEP